MTTIIIIVRVTSSVATLLRRCPYCSWKMPKTYGRIIFPFFPDLNSFHRVVYVFLWLKNTEIYGIFSAQLATEITIMLIVRGAQLASIHGDIAPVLCFITAIIITKRWALRTYVFLTPLIHEFRITISKLNPMEIQVSFFKF